VLAKRIIPCLDVTAGRVVKGVNFVGLRDEPNLMYGRVMSLNDEAMPDWFRLASGLDPAAAVFHYGQEIFEGLKAYRWADGSVVAWGNNSSGQTTLPAGLSNVVAIAAGDDYSLALQADGTLVRWGGLLPPPIGATNVVAIAAGGKHALALRADGVLIGWGGNYYGQATVPASATNALGIAAGAVGIAKILFFVFLVLFLVSLISHLGRGQRV